MNKLTQELLDSVAHIPDSEVRQDIADMEAEIKTMRREEEGLRLIGDRMSVYRADGRRSGIKQREEFIEKLRALLTARSQNQETHK
jgi:LDH2 family malate/lactate/ureidoglycolate dehydrogenase